MTEAPLRYFSVQGLQGRYFDCARLRATLSTESCAARHLGACGGDDRVSCRGCPIGALHSGRGQVPASRLTERMCSRCLKRPQRMVKSRLCVSCYNRTREVHRGANAKGVPPRKLPMVYAGILAMGLPDSGWRVARVESVSRFVETVVSVAAREQAAGHFTWASEVGARLGAQTVARRQLCG